MEGGLSGWPAPGLSLPGSSPWGRDTALQAGSPLCAAEARPSGQPPVREAPSRGNCWAGAQVPQPHPPTTWPGAPQPPEGTGQTLQESDGPGQGGFPAGTYLCHLPARFPYVSASGRRHSGLLGMHVTHESSVPVLGSRRGQGWGPETCALTTPSWGRGCPCVSDTGEQTLKEGPATESPGEK